MGRREGIPALQFGEEGRGAEGAAKGALTPRHPCPSARRCQGNASTLTRGEVRGGGRKPYRQKGTGKARRGSTRSPLIVGGGVVFGPQVQVFGCGWLGGKGVHVMGMDLDRIVASLCRAVCCVRSVMCQTPCVRREAHGRLALLPSQPPPAPADHATHSPGIGRSG